LLCEVINAKYVYVLDVSWLMYRGYYSLGHLSVEGKPTGHIFSVLRIVNSIHSQVPEAAIVLCLDLKSNYRKEIDGVDYKEGRSKLAYNIHQDSEKIVNMATLLDRVYAAKAEGYEADDVMYSIAKKAERERSDSCITIFSGDDDLLQSLSDRIYILRELNKKNIKGMNERDILDDENYKKKYLGILASKIPLFKAIVGDKSDNIKGIERVPKDVLKRVIEYSDTPNSILYLDFPDLLSAKRNRLKSLKENIDIIRRNYGLVKINEINVDVYKGNNIEESLNLLLTLKLGSFRNYVKEVNPDLFDCNESSIKVMDVGGT